MRRLLLGLVFLNSVLLASAQPKEETVIQPRNSPQAGAPVDGTAGSGTNSSFYLASALLLGAGGWWLWQKRKASLGGLAGKPNLLTITETRPLGSRQYLVVADYDGRKFLLGVCPGSIKMLTPLDDEKSAPKEP